MQDLDFPKNELGLVRGSILEAASAAVENSTGLKIGEQIPIGFDGRVIRCQGLDWDIEMLVNEIKSGHWNIVGTIDLSDQARSDKFARQIEKRTDA